MKMFLLIFLLISFNQYMGEGISGLQGCFYGGTGCFHRRKILYGLCPDGCMETRGKNIPNWVGGMQVII